MTYLELLDCMELSDEDKIRAEGLCKDYLNDEIEKFSAIRAEYRSELMFVLKYDEFIKSDLECIDNLKLIISQVEYNDKTIVVEDVKSVMMRFAENYIAEKGIYSVSVTGSIGKTTTKDIIYSVLSHYLPTVRNNGSINGKMGFLRAVTQIKDNTKLLIQEMGLNCPTDFFSDISKAIRPSICVFTNIGSPHIENFDSKEHILDYKLKCTDYLPKDGGKIVINADDEVLMGRKYQHEVITYGINKPADVSARNIIQSNENVTFDVFVKNAFLLSARLNVPGIHNVYGALSAIAVALTMNIPTEVIIEGLASFKTSGIRQNVIHGFRDNTIIFDCYGAAPESDIVAFNMLNDMKSDNRKIAVLGHMMRLGRFSTDYHQKVGLELAKFGFDEVITFSGKADLFTEEVIKAGGNAHHFYDRNEFVSYTKKQIKNKDTILFKGINKFCDFDILVNQIIDTEYIPEVSRYYGLKKDNNNLHCDAEAMILLDLDNGDLLCGKNMHTPIPCGSLCSLVSILSIWNQLELSKELLISEKAISFSKGYNKCGELGEKYSTEDLVWMAIRESACDALYSLVDAYYPNKKDFWKRVRNLILSLGMTNTHLYDCYGKANESNFTSAFDMALLLRKVYKTNELMGILRTAEKNISEIGKNESKVRHVSNRLEEYNFNDEFALYSEDIVIIKETYNKVSKKCLCAIKGHYGLVLLGEPDNHYNLSAYIDTKHILDDVD